MFKHASTNFAVRKSQFTIRRLKLTAECICLSGCCLMLIFVYLHGNDASAAASDVLRYQSGLRNSPGKNRLNTEQLSKLIESLRQKSGFLEMHFDENEFLHLGDRMNIAGGSSLARQLLVAAVDRAQAIDLECHNRSSQVTFARMAKPINYISRASGEEICVSPIEIDFNDFKFLRGDKAAIEAFDLGFVVLHELAHAALGLSDALVNGQEPGECEEYINGIRRELGVPERQSYIAKIYRTRDFPSQGPLQKAELLFSHAQNPESKSKIKTLNLFWETQLVGSGSHTDYTPRTISPRSNSQVAP